MLKNSFGVSLFSLALLGDWGSTWCSAGQEGHPVRAAAPPASFVGKSAPPQTGASAQWQSLSRRLREFVSAREARQEVSTVGVYLFDLAGGGTAAINEKMRYVAASLFKAPLMIACLRQSRAQPGYLEKRLTFPGWSDPSFENYSYPPEKLLERGKNYSVRELIERVATYSDNGAAALLRDSLDPRYFDEVLRATGNSDFFDEEGEAGISPEGLGQTFKLLYDKQFLGDGMSEWLLRTMSKAYFREGLAAGLPEGVAVAHKYGEYVNVKRGRTVVQLHDGGIVYRQGRPYVLCVFTSGWNLKAQATVIAEIARMVDGEISRL